MHGCNKNLREIIFRCAGVDGPLLRRDRAGKFKTMNESRLESNGKERYLVVYYDCNKTNYDEVIQRAMNRHKIEKPITILCMPKSRKYTRRNNAFIS